MLQLRKIKDLALYSAPFVDAAGKFLFRALTCLTSLLLHMDYKDDGSFYRTLEIIHQHAKGIQDLSLYFVGDDVSLDWTPLPAFSKLTSFCLFVNNTDGSLSKALEQMCGLSRLELDYYGVHIEDVFRQHFR